MRNDPERQLEVFDQPLLAAFDDRAAEALTQWQPRAGRTAGDRRGAIPKVGGERRHGGVAGGVVPDLEVEQGLRQRALLGGDFPRTLLVVTLLRIPPFSPFAIVNFVLAAARVPLWNYTLGTALGIAPRTAAAAFVAAGLEQLQAKDFTDTPRWMLLSGMIAFVLMCIVLGSLANRALRTMTAPGK